MANPTDSTPFQTLLGNASANPFGWPASWDDTPLPIEQPEPSDDVQIAQTPASSTLQRQQMSEPSSGPLAISRPAGAADLRRIGGVPQLAPMSRPLDSKDLLPNDPNAPNWSGYELVLPDGSRIADRDPRSLSPSGNVMTPKLNLHEVAAAGRRDGAAMRRQAAGSRGEVPTALPGLELNAFNNVGTGGEFDYQRRHQGNQILDLVGDKIGISSLYEQRRQFLPISNMNVGLYSQQSGLSLEQTLARAGLFALLFSGNYKPDQPYGLDPRTAHFIQEGHKIGQSGMFGRALTPP